MSALWVVLGAALGAPSRYLVDLAVTTRVRSSFPWGTLVVNLTGCLLLGLLTGATLSAVPAALLGTGFCGAYTTYSTFAYEAVALTERRDARAAGLYVGASVVAGLALAALGFSLTS